MTDDVAMGLHELLHQVLDGPGTPGRPPLLHALRAAGGLSAGEEQTLRVMAVPLVAWRISQVTQTYPAEAAAVQERAAADVARFGLRSCALPGCEATEPHPKAYKLCGRCKAAAYCCQPHAAEDWKRHKRVDGCGSGAAAE
jgi:hypothetical protein